jgi:ATP-binding cassette subfamily B multidrug efflux pump
MRRILEFIRPYRRDALAALLLVVLMTGVELAIPGLIQRIIDLGIVAQNMTVVRDTTLWMLAAGLASALLTIGNTVLAVRVTSYVTTDMRSAIFSKIQSFSFSNLDRFHTGWLLVRLTNDVNMLGYIIMMSLRVFLRAPLRLVGSYLLMILISPRLALVMPVLMMATAGIVMLMVRRGHPLFLAVQRKLDWLNTILQENLAGVRVVKAFARAEHEAERFETANAELMTHSMRVMQLFSVLVPTLFLLLNLSSVAVVWYGGQRTAIGALSTGQVVAFLDHLLAVQFPLLLLGSMVGTFSAAQASLDRIEQLFQSRSAIREIAAPVTLSNVRGRVQFEDVSFSYADQIGAPVLSHINLVAEPGERIAILGQTGSGKSTLVHLIPRFYDVTSGRVTIDGVDVRDVTLRSLRSHIGIASQEPVLFSGSIRDNIRFGRPDATDQEVVTVAKTAEADGFIIAFPDGYDAQLAQLGVNLSGGQKQRIAIARALLTRPRILILDDSTSSVDVETEGRIEAALEELMTGCTTFVIAQRLSTVLKADKIIVLERGEIVGTGTHAELMSSSPIYREIFDSQLGDGGELA